MPTIARLALFFGAPLTAHVPPRFIAAYMLIALFASLIWDREKET